MPLPVKNETEKKAKGFSVILLVVFGLLALLLFVFALITDEIVLDKETGFDLGVYHLLASVTGPGLTKMMIFFTFFGSGNFLIPAYLAIVVYFLFFKKSSKHSLGIAAVALSGTGVLFLLKNYFKRPRPEAPLIQKVASFSYPSGHSFSAFAFSGVLIYMLWLTNLKKAWKWLLSVLLFLFAATIALSRVYLHVHYASDVIAGFCLSLLWLALCYYVLGKLNVIQRR